MIRRAAALALFVWSGALDAQSIRMQNAGPGPGPKLLEQELALPHVVIPPGKGRVLLVRDSTYHQTVIVLGRDVVVEGTVLGDVVVVGGDLYVHPGASAKGRLIAFGGGVYRSSLATDEGDVAFREFTYDIVPEGGNYALSYHEFGAAPPRRIVPAGLSGFELPSYDRSNGVSLPLGVDVTLPHMPVRFEPRLTYRSQLGRLDASIANVDSLDQRTAITVWAGRSTFSNEQWIWPDLVNSVEYLVAGNDARNYYRATRERLTIARRWQHDALTVTPYLGAEHEQPTTVRPQSGAEHSPWTMLNRDDPDDALRPNLPVETRGITSALGGFRLDWNPADIVARFDAAVELGGMDRICITCVPMPTTVLAQLTLDGAIEFPTFGTQSLQVRGHGVVSNSGTPHERFAFVGGKGTIPTLEMLELGGNQLAYLDARYNVPIGRVNLPLVGSPVMTLREVLGGAAIDTWPTLREAIGLRASLSMLYGEFMVDPTHHHGQFSVGISVFR